ncbi:MAG TPA: hypothetical protein VFU22_10455 [Roseiflexaceae bacterium]|nr:hypothetical protein [Roseiflexaceae bacterium]
MNTKRTLVVPALGMVVALLLSALAIAQTAQAGGNDRSEKLVGSWEVVVTTVGQGTTFPALLTFNDDGSMLADEPPSPFETSGHGNWLSTGRRAAAFTFISLVGSAEGPLSAKYKVVGALHFDSSSDSWSGPFKIDVADPSGQVVFSDHGTFSLTRIAVERLE